MLDGLGLLLVLPQHPGTKGYMGVARQQVTPVLGVPTHRSLENKQPRVLWQLLRTLQKATGSHRRLALWGWANRWEKAPWGAVGQDLTAAGGNP